MEGIGEVISSAGWTYWALETYNTRSIKPLAPMV